MSKSKEIKPNSLRHKSERAKLIAANTANMGYAALGVALWEQPGIASKVVAGAALAHSLGEQRRAYDIDPILAREPRKRFHQRFSELMESWSTKEGGSLRDRLKRNIGSELTSEDKELKLRFTRVMGGTAMLLGGVELHMTATNTREAVAGGVLALVGMGEQMHNTLAYSDHANDLYKERIAAQTPAKA